MSYYVIILMVEPAVAPSGRQGALLRQEAALRHVVKQFQFLLCSRRTGPGAGGGAGGGDSIRLVLPALL